MVALYMPRTGMPYTIEDTLGMLKSQVEGCISDYKDGKLTESASPRLQGMSNLLRDLYIWTNLETGRIGIPINQEQASLELGARDPRYSIKGIYTNDPHDIESAAGG